MHPHLFLLLLSSGVSSYFLPLEEMPHLPNETKYSLIDEMLCLLEAENEPINEKFFRPLHVKKLSCAHNNTEIFIHELKNIHTWTCMRKVEKGMERLEKICYILKKSSSNDKRCLEMAKTNFSRFKESLQEFLRWVNQKLDCSSVGRSEVDLFLDGKCSCRVPWKSHQGSTDFKGFVITLSEDGGTQTSLNTDGTTICHKIEPKDNWFVSTNLGDIS